MKKIILILLILVVSGCSTQYNLKIDGKKFKEDINIIINKSEIPAPSPIDGVETDDPITPFLTGDTTVFFQNDDIIYNKIVEEFDNYYNINMSYQYNGNEFKNSNSLQLCFENIDFSESKNYKINLSGTFYCMYSDSVSINIESKNRVINNNADSVNGNVYTWNITQENKDNVNIQFEVTKHNTYFEIMFYAGLVVVFVGIVIFIKKIVEKNKKNNEI